MLNPHPLEPDLRQWLQQEWQQVGPPRADEPHESDECCPLPWLLPKLLDLIVRTHDQPITRVRNEIRQLIMEHDFHELAGDRVIDDPHRDSISRTVDRLTRAVERVRHRARAAGQWSAIDSAQYFG